MLKKIIQMSSLVAVLAIAGGLSANASSGNEEDAAAPAGSFTSSMEAPASHNFDVSERQARHERFVLRFAEYKAAYEARHNGEPQK
jgi:hypothetical protein